MKTTTPLKIKLTAIPAFACTAFFLVILVTFSLFWFEGRFDGYFPTISETATGTFNTKFFSSSLTVEAYFVLLTFYLIVIWGQVWDLFPSWFITVGQIIVFYLPLSLIGLSVCPFNFSMTIHQTFAISFFTVLLLFTVMTYFLLLKHLRGGIFVSRTIILIIAFISLVLMLSTCAIKKDFAYTMNGITEMIFVVSIISSIITWVQELKSITAVFYIEE